MNDSKYQIAYYIDELHIIQRLTMCMFLDMWYVMFWGIDLVHLTMWIILGLVLTHGVFLVTV